MQGKAKYRDHQVHMSLDMSLAGGAKQQLRGLCKHIECKVRVITTAAAAVIALPVIEFAVLFQCALQIAAAILALDDRRVAQSTTFCCNQQWCDSSSGEAMGCKCLN
jgi:hypothetical protein